MRLSITDGSGDPVCTLKQKKNWGKYKTIAKTSKIIYIAWKLMTNIRYRILARYRILVV